MPITTKEESKRLRFAKKNNEMQLQLRMHLYVVMFCVIRNITSCLQTFYNNYLPLVLGILFAENYFSTVLHFILNI